MPAAHALRHALLGRFDQHPADALRPALPRRRRGSVMRPTGRVAVDGHHRGGCRRMPTTFLSSVATSGVSAGSLQARRCSCAPPSRRSHGRASWISSASACGIGRLRVANLGRGLRLGRWRSAFLSARQLGAPARLGVVRGAALGFGFALARHHRDVERGAPVLRAEVAQDNARRPRASRSGPCRPSRTPACPSASVSPTLPKRRLPGRPDARADQLEAAVARASRRARRAFVAHSVSSTWRTRPTRPPTSVPLMRIY